MSGAAFDKLRRPQTYPNGSEDMAYGNTMPVLNAGGSPR
jgi:hypothetical protein